MNDNTSSPRTVLPAIWPPQIRDWVETQQSFITNLGQKLESALTDSATAPATREELWQLVAACFSDTWQSAHDAWRASQSRMEAVFKRKNNALSPFGALRTKPEAAAARDQALHALAHFTVVDETLRQNTALMDLTDALASHLGLPHGFAFDPQCLPPEPAATGKKVFGAIKLFFTRLPVARFLSMAADKKNISG